MSLESSVESQERYVALFARIRGWLRAGGYFIISDAGRVNYWDRMGLRSPFARSIEWRKHQEPEVWARLLAEAGFHVEGLAWHRFYPLRVLGAAAANRFVARLTTSQFVLTCRNREGSLR
jgi:hypothetical protein